MGTVAEASDVVLPAEGPEREIARDLARRAAIVSPAFLVLGAVLDGVHGLVSAGLALVLVAGNFLLGAAIIGRAVAAVSICAPSKALRLDHVSAAPVRMAAAAIWRGIDGGSLSVTPTLQRRHLLRNMPTAAGA